MRCSRGRTRVHQIVQPARDEAVVDEDVLFDAERRVRPFEIAGAIAGHAMAQRQVLRPCGRADRIRLHEAEAIERARECRRRKEATGDGEAPQIIERDYVSSLGAAPWDATRPRVSHESRR